MDNDNQLSLRIRSTPTFHIPGMMRYIEHMYKADPTKAIELASDMFNGGVKQNALHEILSGRRQPLFVQDDLDDDSMTYVFSQNEVNMEIVESFHDSTHD